MNRPSTRLDKWLWAARFYKTRPLAAKAIAAGHIQVNGSRAKPARPVTEGDRIEVRKGPFETTVDVLIPEERRASAKTAQTFYRETPESAARREKLKLTLRGLRQQVTYDRERPSAKTRRAARQRKRDLPGV